MPRSGKHCRANYEMQPLSCYAGLDLHRKSISFCAKRADGSMMREGKIAGARLPAWRGSSPYQPGPGLASQLAANWAAGAGLSRACIR